MRFPGKKWLTVMLAAAILLGGGFYVVQRHMLFLASPFAFIPELWGLSEMEVVDYYSYDGTRLSAWYRPPERDGAPVIMYFPGARGHLGWEGYRMEPFLEAGYGVFMMGYRGYGSNPGYPSEYSFYQDASQAAHFLWANGHRMDDIVIYVYSLGTAVAIDLAARLKRVAGVVLEAPVSSVGAILRQHHLYVPPFLIRFNFNSRAKIGRIDAPVFILHGSEDEVVTMSHAEALYRNIRTCSGMIIVSGGDHRNLSELGADAQVHDFVRAVTGTGGAPEPGFCPFCPATESETPTLLERCRRIRPGEDAKDTMAFGSEMPPDSPPPDPPL